MIGRDPRASGEMLEAAVIAGLTSEGVDALRCGVLPTPAVAYLTHEYDADFGVMISASHNPMPDNGIKIFGPGGHKLDDATEDQIEDLVAAGPGLRPVGAGIGRVIDAEDALDRYLRQVGKASTVQLDGLTVVVDCAHGAASAAGPRAYRAAGARVIAINAEPNGLNINDRCGSTHLDVAALGGPGARRRSRTGARRRRRPLPGRRRGRRSHRRRRHHGDPGAGHAGGRRVGGQHAGRDRDEQPRAAPGDARGRGRGAHHRLSATDTCWKSCGPATSASVASSPDTSCCPPCATTGDGILTGLRLMSRMAQTGTSLAGLASAMHTLPQVLINVDVADKAAAVAAPSVQTAVQQVEDELGDTGRILLRPSGTEQMIRVMVEADDEHVAHRLAAHVADQVRATR